MWNKFYNFRRVYKWKLECLFKKEYAIGWRIKNLVPIIRKILMTKRYYNSYHKINDEIKTFGKIWLELKIEKIMIP